MRRLLAVGAFNTFHSVCGLHILSFTIFHLAYNLSSSIWTRETTSSRAKSNKRGSRLQIGKAIAKQVLHLSFVPSLIAAGLKLIFKEVYNLMFLRDRIYWSRTATTYHISCSAFFIGSIPAHSPWNHPTYFGICIHGLKLKVSEKSFSHVQR